MRHIISADRFQILDHIVDHISTRCGSQTIAKIITSSTLLYDIYRYSFNGLYKPTSTQLGVSTLCHQSSSSSLAHSGSCIIIYHYLSWSFRLYYLYKKEIGCMTYTCMNIRIHIQKYMYIYKCYHLYQHILQDHTSSTSYENPHPRIFVTLHGFEVQ